MHIGLAGEKVFSRRRQRNGTAEMGCLASERHGVHRHLCWKAEYLKMGIRQHVQLILSNTIMCIAYVSIYTVTGVLILVEQFMQNSHLKLDTAPVFSYYVLTKIRRVSPVLPKSISQLLPLCANSYSNMNLQSDSSLLSTTTKPAGEITTTTT
jgi:hypothetical protein